MTYQNELKKLIDELERKGERLEALIRLGNSLKDEERRLPMSFNSFLNLASRNPRHALRNVFQLFYDMVQFYVNKVDDAKVLTMKQLDLSITIFQTFLKKNVTILFLLTGFLPTSL